MKRLHYISGLIITVFICSHLYNHVYSLFGVEAHIHVMNKFRIVYRNGLIESILLMAVFVQIFSGLKLFLKKRGRVIDFFEKLQIWSGLYLAIFFTFHLFAVFVGRLILSLDTNIYFGVAGLNAFPFNLFFIPYYALAIISFFAHISAIHAKKRKKNLFGIIPNKQALIILGIGIMLTFIILYGLTGRFKGIEIPSAYNVMIGK